MMQKYNENYFMETPVKIFGNNNLREPQLGAYESLYNHFIAERKKTHAVIVLPTGVGKTGVIGLAPFQIAKGRVLIITPQLTVKDTVIDSLNTDSYMNFWSARDVISNIKDLPVLIEYNGQTIRKEILECASIVVLNVHKLQSRLDSSLLRQVPKDFFDMIIVDEAHHSTANTWVEALEYFSEAKVVKLTGTPFRSDGEKIAGELIFEYKLSQAMANNYIKTLVCNDFIPDRIEFIIDNDENTTYSEEEILEFKDEDWISRTVAYSTNCSRQVVLSSIEVLKEKKRNSDIPHKIIAVACSIEHAKKIEQLYNEHGVRAISIHSNLASDKISTIKNDIENDRVDVVVNVGMLGEGYDHKYLSIAAIFRPFRSALPYEQFVGRILRFIPEGKNPEDNIGHVISHKLLFLEDLWKKYKREYDESKIIQQLAEENHLKESEVAIGGSREVPKDDIGKVRTDGGTLTEDVFLNTELLRQHREKSEEIQKKISALQEALGVSSERAKQIIETEEAAANKFNRPDLMFERVAKDLDLEIKEKIVPRLVVEYISNSLKALEGCRLFATKYKWICNMRETPEGRLAIYFNTFLREKIGKPRKEWSFDDFERAEIALINQVEYVEAILEDYYSQ